jgi:heme A synthase
MSPPRRWRRWILSGGLEPTRCGRCLGVGGFRLAWFTRQLGFRAPEAHWPAFDPQESTGFRRKSPAPTHSQLVRSPRYRFVSYRRFYPDGRMKTHATSRELNAGRERQHDYPTPPSTRSHGRDARRRKEQARRPRQRNPERFLRRAGFLLLLTWLPAAIGALGVRPFTSWAVAAGYLGVSWVLPALLVRAAVRNWAHNRGFPHHKAAGLVGGALAGLILLLAAAALTGP